MHPIRAGDPRTVVESDSLKRLTHAISGKVVWYTSLSPG